MPLWLLLILATLATYRAAHMVAAEDGPFDVFSRLQERAGGQRNWVGRGLGCPLCVGFWLALVPAVWLSSSVGEVLLLWFGVAGAQVILQKLFP